MIQIVAGLIGRSVHPSVCSAGETVRPSHPVLTDGVALSIDMCLRVAFEPFHGSLISSHFTVFIPLVPPPQSLLDGRLGECKYIIQIGQSPYMVPRSPIGPVFYLLGSLNVIKLCFIGYYKY